MINDKYVFYIVTTYMVNAKKWVFVLFLGMIIILAIYYNLENE
jgi:hypothetical protein